jgi:hypothetical protein
MLIVITQLVVFPYGAGGWGSNSNEVIFLIIMSVMALEAIKFHSFFTSLHLFFFLSSFIHI